MPLKVFLTDPKDGQQAQITPQHELLTRLQFSSAEKRQIIDANAVNFVKPLPGQFVIITGVIVNTDRNVGVNGTAIEIFEAASESSTTSTKDILSFDLVKNQNVVATSLLIQTTEGVFINAKADDFNVNITLLSYFTNGS